MLDAAIGGITHASPLAYPLLFIAGLLSSASPCVAARAFMLSGLTRGTRSPHRTAAAYAAGVLLAFVTLGLAAGYLSSRALANVWTELAFAAILCCAGIAELLRGPRHSGSRSAHGHSGVVFGFGALSALVISPCCSPVMLILGAVAARSVNPLPIAAALAAFAAGHALPLALAGWWRLPNRFAASSRLRSSLATINGSVLLGFGIFYGAIA